MLRINLLPIRQLKKRAKARNQIVVVSTLLVFLLLILGAFAFVQNSKIQSVKLAIAKLEAETKTFAPVLAEMKELKNKKKDLLRKISIIKKLKRDSSITVHILDEVAQKVDSKRMWLKSLKQEGFSLLLTGVALDNRTIAQFMDSLKESNYVSTVNLTNASLIKVSGRDLKSFSLVCNIVSLDVKKDQVAQQTTK